jgi:hypothetical protein
MSEMRRYISEAVHPSPARQDWKQVSTITGESPGLISELPQVSHPLRA